MLYRTQVVTVAITARGFVALGQGLSHHYMERSVVVTCGFLGYMIPTTEPSTGIQDGPEIDSG